MARDARDSSPPFRPSPMASEAAFAGQGEDPAQGHVGAFLEPAFHSQACQEAKATHSPRGGSDTTRTGWDVRDARGNCQVSPTGSRGRRGHGTTAGPAGQA